MSKFDFTELEKNLKAAFEDNPYVFNTMKLIMGAYCDLSMLARLYNLLVKKMNTKLESEFSDEHNSHIHVYTALSRLYHEYASKLVTIVAPKYLAFQMITDLWAEREVPSISLEWEIIRHREESEERLQSEMKKVQDEVEAIFEKLENQDRLHRVEDVPPMIPTEVNPVLSAILSIESAGFCLVEAKVLRDWLGHSVSDLQDQAKLMRKNFISNEEWQLASLMFGVDVLLSNYTDKLDRIREQDLAIKANQTINRPIFPGVLLMMDKQSAVACRQALKELLFAYRMIYFFHRENREELELLEYTGSDAEFFFEFSENASNFWSACNDFAKEKVVAFVNLNNAYVEMSCKLVSRLWAVN